MPTDTARIPDAPVCVADSAGGPVVPAGAMATVEELITELRAARETDIGFPGAVDLDFSPLGPLMAGWLVNNVGDPWSDGLGRNHTKALEREVLQAVADLLRAPAGWWGQVTHGGTEGALAAIAAARRRFPDPVLFRSQAAHRSVAKVAALLRLDTVVVRAFPDGQLDYDDLHWVLGQHRHRPAIVVATVGTTMTEAVDDVRRVATICDGLAIERRWVHADAALSGVPLALLDSATRPGFDFADGADSVVVSGHKFFGTPLPCGVLLTREHPGTGPAAYTGSPDTTIAGSRNGHAALALWWALRRYSLDHHRQRAADARNLAAYAHAQLAALGLTAIRHPFGFTVAFPTPPCSVTDKWVLATDNGWSHLVCMPGIARKQIDTFLGDLHGANAPRPTAPTAADPNGRVPARRKAPQ